MKKHICSTALLRAPANHGDARITISTIDEDREGDVLVPEGAKLDAFNRNPVVLFGHDHSAIPVARAVHVVVTPGVGIQADFVWLKDDPFADRVRNAFDQGVLNAASVGFLPHKWEPNDGGKGGLRFTEWEMLEFSIVPVPANASAVRTLKQFGLDGPAPLMRATAVLDQLTAQLKDGRVLSDANAERLQQAQALLGEVLAEEDDDEEEADDIKDAAMVLNEDGTIATLSADMLESAIDQVVSHEVERSTGTVDLSEATIHQAVTSAVDQQISKLTGRIPDEEPILLAMDDEGYTQPLDMTQDELAELIEATVRATIDKGIAKVTGRISD